MFKTPLDVRWVRGSKDKAELLAPLEYVTESGIPILVPRWFVTDFASVPKIFWSLFPKTGKYRDAAVVHDYLYRYNGFGFWSRAGVDKIFIQAMKELEVPWWKRQALWSAVRIGGWKTWRKYNAQNESSGFEKE